MLGFVDKTTIGHLTPVISGEILNLGAHFVYLYGAEKKQLYDQYFNNNNLELY